MIHQNGKNANVKNANVKRSVHLICIEQIYLCLPTVEGDFVVTERSLSQRF